MRELERRRGLGWNEDHELGRFRERETGATTESDVEELAEAHRERLGRAARRRRLDGKQGQPSGSPGLKDGLGLEEEVAGVLVLEFSVSNSSVDKERA